MSSNQIIFTVSACMLAAWWLGYGWAWGLVKKNDPGFFFGPCGVILNIGCAITIIIVVTITMFPHSP